MKSSLELKIYSFLLKLYPEEFEKEYREEMIILFEDLLKEARYRRFSYILFWGNIFIDTIRSIKNEHMQTNSKFRKKLFDIAPTLLILPSLVTILALFLSNITSSGTYVERTIKYLDKHGLELPLLFLIFIVTPLLSLYFTYKKTLSISREEGKIYLETKQKLTITNTFIASAGILFMLIFTLPMFWILVMDPIGELINNFMIKNY